MSVILILFFRIFQRSVFSVVWPRWNDQLYTIWESPAALQWHATIPI